MRYIRFTVGNTHSDFRVTAHCRIVPVVIDIARRDTMRKQWTGFRVVLGLCAAFGLIAGCMTQIKDAGDDSSPRVHNGSDEAI